MSRKGKEMRWRRVGSGAVQRLRLMAVVEGYAMVRVVGACPFVMPLKGWLQLPLVTPATPGTEGAEQ